MDVNWDLINTYDVVKKDPCALLQEMKSYRNDAEFYYDMRSSSPTTATKKAARFLYLSRLSFNGIYRVNLKGVYNVPYGWKAGFPVVDGGHVMAVSVALQGVDLKVGDFAGMAETAVPGDLSDRSTSPFYKRILMADEKATSKRCISLQSMAAALRKPGFYIVREQYGRVLEFGPLWATKADPTLLRSKTVIDSWFSAIIEDASGIWALGKEEGGFLAMNDGVVVSLEVLRSVFEHFRSKGQNCLQLTSDEVADLICPFGKALGKWFAGLTPAQLADIRRARGIQGQTDTVRKVQSALRDEFKDFSPPNLEEWLANRAEGKMTEAYELTTSIESRVQNAVMRGLKQEFGDAESKWWPNVPLSVRRAAATRREEDNSSRGGNEKYLDLIDYREIIRDNWLLFEANLAYGDSGSKDKRTDWLVDVNKIRNKVMHKSSGGLTLQEFERLEGLNTWLASQDN